MILHVRRQQPQQSRQPAVETTCGAPSIAMPSLGIAGRQGVFHLLAARRAVSERRQGLPVNLPLVDRFTISSGPTRPRRRQAISVIPGSRSIRSSTHAPTFALSATRRTCQSAEDRRRHGGRTQMTLLRVPRPGEELPAGQPRCRRRRLRRRARRDRRPARPQRRRQDDQLPHGLRHDRARRGQRRRSTARTSPLAHVPAGPRRRHGLSAAGVERLSQAVVEQNLLGDHGDAAA